MAVSPHRRHGRSTCSADSWPLSASSSWCSPR